MSGKDRSIVVERAAEIETAMRVANEIGGDVSWRDVIDPDFFLPSQIRKLFRGSCPCVETSGCSPVSVVFQFRPSNYRFENITFNGDQNSVGNNETEMNQS